MATFLSAVSILVAVALVAMFAISLVNAVWLPRLRPFTPPSGASLPPVSVLVPARNEASNITRAIDHLLAQDYPSWELLVLDDDSTDGTGDLAQFAAGQDPRFRLLSGAALPEGWSGKNWACHQLACAAQNDTFIFTDADVMWRPNALVTVVHEFEQRSAALLTVWPTQETRSRVERLVVPLMAFAVHAYLPTPLVTHTHYASAAAATGQCLVFDRAAYHAIGGHAAIRDTVLEDVILARRVKCTGKSLAMAEGNDLLTCRMYEGAQATILGYAKNILAGFGYSIPLLVAATLAHLAIFDGPWLWLLLGTRWRVAGWPMVPLALGVAGILVRAITAASSRQRIVDSVFMPLSVLTMSYIAFRAIWIHLRGGGPEWKGRRLPAYHAHSHTR